MIGSSRTSVALVREAVDAAYGDPELEQAGRDLLAVADLVTREKSLRQALADSGRPASQRDEIVTGLVGQSVSPLALQITRTVVSQRWSTDADMVDSLEIAGASALLAAAERSGSADRVEEELFRFSRIMDANGELQLTLSSTSIAPDVKRGVLSELLEGKADPTTIELASFAVTHLRGRRVDDAMSAMVELAAVRRAMVSAVVRVAAPLADEQRERLAAALQRLYGRPVQVSLDIDPTLIGGMSVQVGDEIIDGTLSTKIDQARRRLAG